jgi:hypothetical protein
VIRATGWGGLWDRPKQTFEVGKSIDFMLPAVDANVSQRIAGTVKQHERKQPPCQGLVHVCRRVSEARKQPLHAARHPAGHESAGAQEIVLAPSGHDIAEVDQPR